MHRYLVSHATKAFNTVEGGVVTFLEHKLYEKLYKSPKFGASVEKNL